MHVVWRLVGLFGKDFLDGKVAQLGGPSFGRMGFSDHSRLWNRRGVKHI